MEPPPGFNILNKENNKLEELFITNQTSSLKTSLCPST